MNINKTILFNEYYIPKELDENILSTLNLPTLNAIALVSHAWKEISDNALIWKGLCKEMKIKLIPNVSYRSAVNHAVQNKVFHALLGAAKIFIENRLAISNPRKAVEFLILAEQQPQNSLPRLRYY